MGAPSMRPITDESGRLRPDLDFRDVPLAVMAAYLNIHKTTLWRRTVMGMYRGCTRKVGTVTCYLPRKLVGVE